MNNQEENSPNIKEVSHDPASFTLIVAGHNDHPECNGQYNYYGEENGKPMYVMEGVGKLFWTGESWDICWGGYSPEAPIDTPVPPLKGYTND